MDSRDAGNAEMDELKWRSEYGALASRLLSFGSGLLFTIYGGVH